MNEEKETGKEIKGKIYGLLSMACVILVVLAFLIPFTRDYVLLFLPIIIVFGIAFALKGRKHKDKTISTIGLFGNLAAIIIELGFAGYSLYRYMYLKEVSKETQLCDRVRIALLETIENPEIDNYELMTNPGDGTLLEVIQSGGDGFKENFDQNLGITYENIQYEVELHNAGMYVEFGDDYREMRVYLKDSRNGHGEEISAEGNYKED